MQKLSIGGRYVSKSSGKAKLYSESFVYACVLKKINEYCPFAKQECLTIQIKQERNIIITTSDSQTAMQLQMNKITLEEGVNEAFETTNEKDQFSIKIKKI